MWFIFPKNMSYKGTDKGKAKKKRKQSYLPKGILFVSDVQDLFEYLTVSPQSVFLVVYAQKENIMNGLSLEDCKYKQNNIYCAIKYFDSPKCILRKT